MDIRGFLITAAFLWFLQWLGRKNSFVEKWFTRLVTFALVGYLGWSWGISIIVGLAILVAVFTLSVLWHELGHIVIGKLVGIPNRLLYVSPILGAVRAEEASYASASPNRRVLLKLGGVLFGLPAVFIVLPSGSVWVDFLAELFILIGAVNMLSPIPITDGAQAMLEILESKEATWTNLAMLLFTFASLVVLGLLGLNVKIYVLLLIAIVVYSIVQTCYSYTEQYGVENVPAFAVWVHRACTWVGYTADVDGFFQRTNKPNDDVLGISDGVEPVSGTVIALYGFVLVSYVGRLLWLFFVTGSAFTYVTVFLEYVFSLV